MLFVLLVLWRIWNTPAMWSGPPLVFRSTVYQWILPVRCRAHTSPFRPSYVSNCVVIKPHALLENVTPESNGNWRDARIISDCSSRIADDCSLCKSYGTPFCYFRISRFGSGTTKRPCSRTGTGIQWRLCIGNPEWFGPTVPRGSLLWQDVQFMYRKLPWRRGTMVTTQCSIGNVMIIESYD